MTLVHRDLDQSNFSTDRNLSLWADDGDLAVRFVIPHEVFVEAFNGHPSDMATDRFRELVVTVRAACDWAYAREKHDLKADARAANIVVTPHDFSKARKWLSIGVQRND